MDTNTYTAERDKLAVTEETNCFTLKDLPNDPDRVNDYLKNIKNFVLDEEDDMIADLSQIVPDSRPYDKSRYESILMNSRSSRAVCEIFEKEPCGLLQSDASESEFSLKQILDRMATGHSVYKYNYNSSSRKIVTIRIMNGIVEISSSKAKSSRIGFKDVYGIILGASSSTFKLFKKNIDSKYGYLHSPENCFSIINELRSYDFATISELAKYDVCLSLSWLCSLNNSLQSSLPFTKFFLSFKNILNKLKGEARLRYVSLCELFILAIYKTTKQLDNAAGALRIVNILNKRFTFSGKLYRFIRFIVMPMLQSNIITQNSVKDKIRANLLVNNKLSYLTTVIKQYENKPDKLRAKTKRTVLESMIVPSIKTLFSNKQVLDPFLAMLRQKARR